MILFENEHLLVISKDHGVPAQMGTGLSLESRGDIAVDKMLEAYLITKGLNPTDGKLVHRIDQKTSGLLALAKSKEMASWLSQLFRERNEAVKKTYFALMCGVPRYLMGNIRQSSLEDLRGTHWEVESTSDSTRGVHKGLPAIMTSDHS
jgi:23S rRNA pseudouridine955/2504/2580 synthase